MDNSMLHCTLYEDSYVDVSGLPEMPSLVRIDRESISVVELRRLKVDDNTTTQSQMFSTVEIFYFSLIV